MTALNASAVLGVSVCEHQKEGGAGLGWLLWAVAFSAPWLLPTHAEPWTAFYSEILTVALMLPVLVWALLSSGRTWIIGWPVLFIICLSCIPLIQGVMGLLIMPAESILLTMYMVMFAAAVALGEQAKELGSCKLIESLFASIFIAAVLSAGISIYQWFNLDWLGVLVMSREGVRISANVAQPNNLSTLLVWGVIAIWWGYLRHKVSGVITCLSVAFLLVGVALTQSRTGWLQLAFVVGFAFIWRDLLKTRRCAVIFLFFIAWFVLFVFMVSAYSGYGIFKGAAGTQLLSAGLRPQFWMMAVEGIADRPVTGYGWNQVVLVHEALADKFANLGEVMGYSHNILLDLLLWNGLLLGGFVIVGLGWWCLKIASSLKAPEHALLAIGVGVFLIHSMLELPHTYTFFLIPVGLMLGTLTAGFGVRVSRKIIIAIGAISTWIVIIIFNDYRSIEAEYTGYRMHAARIEGAEVPVAPNIIILRSLHAALAYLRLQPQRNMLSADLDGLRRTVIRYPVTNGLIKYAHAAALNGRPAEAAWALRLICNLRGPAVCDSVVKEWKSVLVTEDSELGLVKLPVFSGS